MRKIFFIGVIFLCTIVILVNISSSKGGQDEWYSYKTNYKDIDYKIKILPVSENGESKLNKGDNVLIIVHGIIGRAKGISEDFAKDFASLVGANKVVLLEYAPDHFYWGDLSAKWSDNAAAYKLADLTTRIIDETGEGPIIYCHSNGNSICNKAAHFMQGKESYLPPLKPTDKMKKARWKAAILVSAHLRYKENLEDMENSISGQTSDGDIPLYVFYSETDIIAPNGLGWSKAKNIKFDILSYLNFDNSEGLGIWTHKQWMNPELLPLYKEKLSKEKLNSIKSSKEGTSTPTPIPPLPMVTPTSTDTYPPYPPPTNTPPPWDDGNRGGSLGGVDFTDININSISSNISVGPINRFGYTFKTKKANNGDKIINIEDMAELSLNSFFVGLTIPKSEFWVNLNLWEPDRIIEKDLEPTDIGRIMLESDLRMKKNFGKYEDPCQSEIGTKYWELLVQKREELITNVMKKYPDDIKDIKNVQFVPVTRHWIIPDRIDVYETDDEIYIINATVSISSDPVYDHSEYQIINQNTLFMSKSSKEELDAASKEYGRYVKELEEEMIGPLVVHDVNENYSELMRVYISLALAQWYKDKYRYSNSSFINIIDSKNLKGLETKSVWSAEYIWKDYKKSFEEGDYNCWKNETYQQGDYTITRSKLYSGGGVDFTNIKINNKGDIPENLKELVSIAKSSSFAKTGDDYYFGDELYLDINNANEAANNGANDEINNAVNNEVNNDVNNNVNNNVNKEKQEDQKVSGFIVAIGILIMLIIYRKIKNDRDEENIGNDDDE